MAGGGGGDNKDTSLDFVWLIGALVVGVLLAWYFGRPYITAIVFHVRLAEIFATNYVIALWAKLAVPLHLPIPSVTLLQQWQTFMTRTEGPVTFKTLSILSEAVGTYIRYPIILILALLAWRLSVSSDRFQHTYDIKILRQLEQENWPQIAPVVALDLAATPLDKSPWAMAISPIKFCKKYKLIREEKKGSQVIAQLLRGPAYRVLSLQLGQEWRGAKALPPHLRALFALFVARVNGDRKVAADLIPQFAISAAHGKLDMSGVDDLIKKHQNAKEVTKIVQLHAYTTTVMASLLAAAREAGVLASSEFIWLKPMDRRMWYMLNCVGRTTPFAEITGAFAHWLAEKKLGLPLTIPMVEEGVNGLEKSLKDTIYKPGDEE